MSWLLPLEMANGKKHFINKTTLCSSRETERMSATRAWQRLQSIPAPLQKEMLKKFLAGKQNLTVICYCQKIHSRWQTIINVTQSYHRNEKHRVLPTGGPVRKRLKGIQKLVKMLFPAGKHSQRRTSASEYPFAHNVIHDMWRIWSPGFT